MGVFISEKRREILEREELLLDIARRILLKSGYHGLTMARIGEAAECSKGTVYQHFSCKEDLIVALATRSVDKQRTMVERAATLRGWARERMLAVGEATVLFARLYQDDTRIFQIMTGEAILQKASMRSISLLKASAHRTVDVMIGIVRDAIAHGDLTLDPNTKPEDLVYPLWVLGDGLKGAAWSWMSYEEIGATDPYATIIKHGLILADGYGWKPLSSEWDHTETLQRVRRELFPVESRKVYGMAKKDTGADGELASPHGDNERRD
ncbi:MAG: TetR/AcrR family transcriptional regulator [Candidatus Hydrogenedentes bacterium]|nr:TetR/AcrR family transcriptional regulator [Candidatus Hydrogenedentota bacterium]